MIKVLLEVDEGGADLAAGGGVVEIGGGDLIEGVADALQRRIPAGHGRDSESAGSWMGEFWGGG